MAAQAAKSIKSELKKEFPTIKFSVKSSNFSMGDSVDVSWIDGPSQSQVEEITRKYQYGSFDGMQDLYEYTNSRDDIPQAKWVQTSRTISDEIYLKYFEEMRPKWDCLKDVTDIRKNCSEFFEKTRYWTAQSFIWKEINNLDFTPKQEIKKETQKVVSSESFNLVDYSEKAIALFGDTKPIKDKLKELGGRFNPFLKFNGEKTAGWIFKKDVELDLKTLIGA